MRDPYLYQDMPVLVNRLGIRDADQLKVAEGDITSIRIAIIDDAIAGMAFDFERLLAIHQFIFGDIYAWAGTPRTVMIYKGERVLGDDTVRYAPPADIERDSRQAIQNMNDTDWAALDIAHTAKTFAEETAALWQAHPFREGNTRAVMAFATQFAEAHHFRMDKNLLRDSAGYVRTALVKASDGAYADYSYLTQIFEDAIRRGR